MIKHYTKYGLTISGTKPDGHKWAKIALSVAIMALYGISIGYALIMTIK